MSVGQIYLLDNPLLTEPLNREYTRRVGDDRPDVRDWTWQF